MKRYILILILGVIFTAKGAIAQDSDPVTLKWCLSQAKISHPLFGQPGLVDRATGLKIKNLNKNYFPDLSLNGQASYQSDVTKVPVNIPESPLRIEPIDKDWYKITLDLNQVIYDGGATGKSKSLEEIENELQKQDIETSLYQLNGQVIQVYFSILALHKNLELLESHEKVVTARLDEVIVAVEAGSVLESNADILRAELLKLQQKKTELTVRRRYSYKILSELVSEEIPDGTVLEVPGNMGSLPPRGAQRPEYALFDHRQRKLEATKEMTAVAEIPKLMAFGQLGYGRPGYDMLNNEFDDFYMVGLRLQWDLWNWGKVKNEKQVLDIQKEIVTTNRDAFTRSLTIEQQHKLSEIGRFEEMIKHDEQIVPLRDKIAGTAASQLRNGVITSTEYLAEQNAATEARMMLEIHQLQQLQAQYEYLLTIGEL